MEENVEQQVAFLSPERIKAFADGVFAVAITLLVRFPKRNPLHPELVATQEQGVADRQ